MDKLTVPTRYGFEILNLLMSAWVYASLRPESDDTIENLRTMHLIKAVYDDIVLRLCKLAEDNRRSLGGEQAVKWLRSAGASPERIQAAEAALADLKQYADEIRPYRNKRLAHIGKEDPPLKAHPSVRPGILAAVQFADALAGQRDAYAIEGANRLDLRAEVLGDLES